MEQISWQLKFCSVHWQPPSYFAACHCPIPPSHQHISSSHSINRDALQNFWKDRQRGSVALKKLFLLLSVPNRFESKDYSGLFWNDSFNEEAISKLALIASWHFLSWRCTLAKIRKMYGFSIIQV